MVGLLKQIFANLGRSPATRLYPAERRPHFENSRGQIDMDVEKCTFCTLCAKRCPCNAIQVTRDPKSWTLDPYRCIICGYCVDVCPKKCIKMRTDHRS